MKTFSALALALGLAACAGSSAKKDTLTTVDQTTKADHLDDAACGAEADHMAQVADATVDKASAVANCKASGTAAHHDCVMAAADTAALAACEPDGHGDVTPPDGDRPNENPAEPTDDSSHGDDGSAGDGA